jgi:hypothetical protein
MKMEKLLKIKKKKKELDKEFVASGLDFLLNYKDDASKLRARGLNDLNESEDERPEEISSRAFEAGFGK